MLDSVASYLSQNSDRFLEELKELLRIPTVSADPTCKPHMLRGATFIHRQFADMGGQASVRLRDGQPLVTDNGQHILDVRGLKISQALAFETEVSQWPGVVTVGVFAHQRAQICLLGTPEGVQTLNFSDT